MGTVRLCWHVPLFPGKRARSRVLITVCLSRIRRPFCYRCHMCLKNGSIKGTELLLDSSCSVGGERAHLKILRAGLKPLLFSVQPRKLRSLLLDVFHEAHDPYHQEACPRQCQHQLDFQWYPDGIRCGRQHNPGARPTPEQLLPGGGAARRPYRLSEQRTGNL